MVCQEPFRGAWRAGLSDDLDISVISRFTGRGRTSAITSAS
jgi:hypothetical protein